MPLGALLERFGVPLFFILRRAVLFVVVDLAPYNYRENNNCE